MTPRLMELLDEYAECAVDDMYETDRGSQSEEAYRKTDEERQAIIAKIAVLWVSEGSP